MTLKMYKKRNGETMKCLSRLSITSFDTCQKEAVAVISSPGQQSYYCEEHLNQMEEAIAKFHLDCSEITISRSNSGKAIEK